MCLSRSLYVLFPGRFRQRQFSWSQICVCSCVRWRCAEFFFDSDLHKANGDTSNSIRICAEASGQKSKTHEHEGQFHPDLY